MALGLSGGPSCAGLRRGCEQRSSGRTPTRGPGIWPEPAEGPAARAAPRARPGIPVLPVLPATLQRAAWAAPSPGSGRFSRPRCPAPPAHLCRPHRHSVEPGAMASKGPARRRPGQPAPDRSDNSLPAAGPAITVACGGGRGVKANVFLMFLSLKKEKRNRKWEPAGEAEPATQASASWKDAGAGGGLPCALGLRASGGAATPEIYISATDTGRAEGDPREAGRHGALRGLASDFAPRPAVGAGRQGCSVTPRRGRAGHEGARAGQAGRRRGALSPALPRPLCGAETPPRPSVTRNLLRSGLRLTVPLPTQPGRSRSE